MKNLPQARTENLVEQNLGKEVLIYDLLKHKAFNLNETLAVVYKACDGQTCFAELKHHYKFTDEFIYLALDELKRSELLADDDARQSLFNGTSRREVIKKVGLATLLTLPLIAGLVRRKLHRRLQGRMQAQEPLTPKPAAQSADLARWKISIWR